MLYDENITIKQIVYLLISCGFQKCELWTEKAYINANHHTKRFRSHRIASKKMNLLHEAGMDYKDAQKLVIMEGKQKVNKTNSSLLGKPLWIGTIQELSNKQSLWITWVLDGFVSETCNRLGIECEDTHSRHNEAMLEEIHDIVKDVLFEKISASSETERKTREKKALIEKLEKIKDIAHDDSEAERVSTHIWNKAIEECIYTVKSFDAKE